MPTRKKPSGKTLRHSQSRKKASSGKKAASKPARKPQAPRRLRALKRSEENIFVYECTRSGCGYRIWRDDRGQAGELRFDLKCPKCHNKEFKCLGRGEIPESFNLPDTTALDLDAIKPAVLGSSGIN